jgi:hypothetical protein
MATTLAFFRAGKLPHELAYGVVAIFLLGVAYFFFNGTKGDN